MAPLQAARQKLRLVLIAMLVLDVIAGALMLSPLGRSRAAREREYDRVRDELQQKRAAAMPLIGMDKKLEVAREEIGQFYKERLPGHYSEIPAELGKVAAANGVRLADVKYEPADADIEGLRQVSITTAVSGNYLQEVKFLNALERNKMFFLVDSVELGADQGGQVKVQMRIETFLKEAS